MASKDDRLKQITGRIEAGTRFMKPHADKEQRFATRYIDSSAKSLSQDPETQGTLPVGEVNYMAMNIRQKVSSMAVGAPDFLVRTGDPMNSELIRKDIKDNWRRKKWGAIFRRVLTSRFVGGAGFVTYLWDRKEGFKIEYVHSKDLFMDPNTTYETWSNVRHGGRYIYLPREVAEARYGKVFDPPNEDPDRALEDSGWETRAMREKNAVKIALYFDEIEQVEMYGDKVLKAKRNWYDRVPIRALIGDPNPHPDSEFPLSDYDTSLGTFEMYRRMLNVMNNTAANGGGLFWLRSEFIDEAIRQKVVEGTHQGPILVTGLPGNEAVGYTAAQTLSDSVLKSIEMMQRGLSSDQGVNDYDRGVLGNDKPEFATEAALLARRSGSRGTLARIDFEQFIEDLIMEMIRLTQQFGLDPANGEPTDEAVALWEAYKDVLEIRIVEESLGFKDPSLVQQQNMQLMESSLGLVEIMAAQGKVPNFIRLYEDTLRSFDRKNTDEYLIPIQLPVPGQEPGASPGANGQAGPPLPGEAEQGATPAAPEE